MPVLLTREFYKQRSLEGSSLWGHKELDTAVHLTHTHTHTRARTHTHTRDFPCGASGKKPPANKANRRDRPPPNPGCQGRCPGGGNGYPLQYSWPGEFRRQRSLADYCPWSRKESDRTKEQYTFMYYFMYIYSCAKVHGRSLLC